MKIQCDVCDKTEASVFCPADEAALCHGCDRSIHQANKLASKHTRFSLLYPSHKESPICDICQERRAFLFCKEDRAILCRECDISIHKINEHTQRHTRFLLTGVKLSVGASLFPIYNSSSDDNGTAMKVEGRSSNSCEKRPPTYSSENFSSPSIGNSSASATWNWKVEDNMVSDTASASTSSISEYLIETLPGWRVEDFIDPSFGFHGFCKKKGFSLLYEDKDIEGSICSVPPYFLDA